MGSYIRESIKVKERILSDQNFLDTIADVAKQLGEALGRGNKILVAGNGGSAADAQHFATELVVKYDRARKAYPAIALTTDTSILTAAGNDFGFGDVFARQVEALSKEGDVLIVLSTSGMSKNLFHAAKKARECGVCVIGFLGKDGGELKNFCNIALVVPSEKTSHIQEVHITLIHNICEELEKGFK